MSAGYALFELTQCVWGVGVLPPAVPQLQAFAVFFEQTDSVHFILGCQLSVLCRAPGGEWLMRVSR